MKPLHHNEYLIVSGGTTGCEVCDAIKLEKECRDDLNTGFAMGAAVGALATKHSLGQVV